MKRTNVFECDVCACVCGWGRMSRGMTVKAREQAQPQTSLPASRRHCHAGQGKLRGVSWLCLHRTLCSQSHRHTTMSRFCVGSGHSNFYLHDFTATVNTLSHLYNSIMPSEYLPILQLVVFKIVFISLRQYSFHTVNSTTIGIITPEILIDNNKLFTKQSLVHYVFIYM